MSGGVALGEAAFSGLFGQVLPKPIDVTDLESALDRLA